MSDPREASRALRADTIVEGSLRKNGDAVRVDVRLVDAVTGGVVWAGEIEGAPSDLFIVEDEVACRVSAALTGRPCAMRAAVDRGTHDLEAYRSYLRGRFHIHSQYGAAGTSARAGDSRRALHPRDRARRSFRGRTRGACRCLHAARLVRAGRCAASPRPRQGGRAPSCRAQRQPRRCARRAIGSLSARMAVRGGRRGY